jgi:hypothetical protein
MSLEEIGAFSTADARRVWQATLAMERRSKAASPSDYMPESEPITFRNDSGETIPAYACVQLFSTADESDRNIFVAKKPVNTTTANVDQFVFNNEFEVAIDAYGTAQSGPVFRATKTGSIASGVRVGPVNSSWKIDRGAFWTNLGTDDVQTDCVRLMSNDSLLLAVATTGVPARSGTTLGKATVAVRHLTVSGSNRVIADSSWTVDAYNVAATAVNSGSYVMLLRLSDVFVVVWEEC